MTTRRERPAFAAGWPDDPALATALDAFSRGDFASARRTARELARHDDQAVRRAALELVARTSPDPLTGLLLVIAGVLLAVLFGYWLAHDEPPAKTAPTGSVRVEGVERVP
jgi:hypothetical protein